MIYDTFTIHDTTLFNRTSSGKINVYWNIHTYIHTHGHAHAHAYTHTHEYITGYLLCINYLNTSGIWYSNGDTVEIMHSKLIINI